VDVLGQSFRSFHRKTVQVQVVLVAIFRKPLACNPGGLLPDRDDLQAHDIERAVLRMEKVGDAQVLLALLAREDETCNLFGIVFRIQVVFSGRKVPFGSIA
jgi:hypothetical protein